VIRFDDDDVKEEEEEEGTNSDNSVELSIPSGLS
jgi:hypothetical protein